MHYRPISFYERRLVAGDHPTLAALNDALKVAELVQSRGGRALVVGGYVRDDVLRSEDALITSKDIDIEVYGLPFTELISSLRTLPHPINVVGEQFGVIKYGSLDISIPRRDSKTGTGHRDFLIDSDPTMSIKEAARRRDLTVNTLALDPLTAEYFDEYGAIEDIKQKTLRTTDAKLFIDDPLRVLRVMQFASRLNFSIEQATIDLCRGIDLGNLPKERIGEEWKKLLLKSDKPGIGMEAARTLGVIKQLHPELQALIGLDQEFEWHPEGDVWTHTVMAVDEAAKICRREKLDDDDSLTVLLATLCHDFGKATTTTFSTERQRIISHGHETAGLKPAKSFLASVDTPLKIKKKIYPLIADHLFPSLNKDAGSTAIRRLATRLHPATIQQLVYVSEADHHGRKLPWDSFPEGKALIEKAITLTITSNKPLPLIQGRDLIAAGLQPSKLFGQILETMFEAQQEGVFTNKIDADHYLVQYLIGHDLAKIR